MEKTDLLVIGAGHAGVAVVAELRRLGYAGTVTLLNGEPIVPYHRPPLSKAWLKGETDGSSTTLQDPSFFEAHRVRVRASVQATELDTDTRRVVTDTGELIEYGQLVLATGALARGLSLPGGGHAPLMQLRDAADAHRLRDLLVDGSRLAIIGGGFIGLEVAATATQLGARVCVIERDVRVLGRLASERLSGYLTDLHRGNGVEILVDAVVERIESADDHSRTITLGDGSTRVVDHILVAIGAIPNDRLAREAGVICDNGIVVDERGRTSVSEVFAIGDVARRPLGPYADSARLESVHNANEQARIVAAEIVGHTPPLPATPWFWSDQFDCKLQIAGLLPAGASTELVGDPSTGSFALLHSRGESLVCVEAVNASREFALGRRRIAQDLAKASVQMATPA